MDLQEFIKATITSIARATHELQSELADIEVLVNPPSLSGKSDIKTTYDPTSPQYYHRHLQLVEFDVAVTASEESTKDAEVGVKLIQVFSAGVSASDATGQENVTRVKFTIPLTLPPHPQEKENLEKASQSGSSS